MLPAELRQNKGTVVNPSFTSTDDPFVLLFCGWELPQAYENAIESFQSNRSVQVVRCRHNELKEYVHRAHVLVPLNARLDRNTLLKAKKCRLIIQNGVGLEKVDISAANYMAIYVSNMPSGATGNALSCAELAIYLMLAALRKAHEIKAAFQSGEVGFPTGQTLWGKTCLLLGFGDIAAELAPRLVAFGVRVIAVRRSPWGDSEAERLVDLKGSWDDRFAFASQADLVALACTQCQATMGLINAHFLAACKLGVTIVNVARGGLLDYEAIKQGLVDGRIGALGLDVQWEEPFNPNDFLSRHPRVHMTNHVGGVTDLAQRGMAATLKREVERAMAGFPPTVQVNRIEAGFSNCNRGNAAVTSGLRPSKPALV